MSSGPQALFVGSPGFEGYRLRDGHPFKPVRVEATRSLLELAGLLGPQEVLAAPPATLEEVVSVHAPAYVARVRAGSRGEPLPDANRWGLGGSDTPVFAGMHEAAAAAVGGTLAAARLVAEGIAARALNLAGGLHHAHRDRASGFCVYNDLSAAILDLRSRGLRVAYVDLDAHHGDGVQWLHYEDPGVLTLSLHETGRHLFPGTGFTYELGRGLGLGTSLNVPLEPFTEDDGFLEALERVLPPALAWFGPDVVVLQAGADAHALDPLADLALSLDGFRRAFRLVREAAGSFAGGRLVATGGGGYATWDAVPRVWAVLWAELSGRALPAELPAEWRARWAAQAEADLPLAWGDPPFAVARQAEIERRNRRVVGTLLEDWRRVTRQGG